MEKATQILLVDERPDNVNLICQFLDELGSDRYSIAFLPNLNSASSVHGSAVNYSHILLGINHNEQEVQSKINAARALFTQSALIVYFRRIDFPYVKASIENIQEYFILEDMNSLTLSDAISRSACLQQLRNKLARSEDAERKTEQELIKAKWSLKELSARQQNILENERAKIAREIHDDLGQQLTGLKMEISFIKRRLQNDAFANEKLNNVLSLIDETIGSVRKISNGLRLGILDDIGLVAAMDWQNVEFEKRLGIRCRFENRVENMAFRKNLATGIFRIFQETLTNIARHAHADEIHTTFDMEDHNLVLTVKDNGKGFDELLVSGKKTLGLMGMRERANMLGGKYHIDSIINKGTTSTLVIPLKTNDQVNALTL